MERCIPKCLSRRNGRCIVQQCIVCKVAYCFVDDVFSGVRSQKVIHDVSVQVESTVQQFFRRVAEVGSSVNNTRGGVVSKEVE